MTGNNQVFQWLDVGSLSFFYHLFDFRNDTNFFFKK